MKEESGTLCFVVHGDFLTDLCRTLWADEDNPVKALRILDCLHEMTEEIAIRILTGKAKLVGNSSDGVFLEADNQEVSKHGNPLDLVRKMQRMMFQAEEGRFLMQARAQLKSGNIKFTGSPWGGIFLPSCVWERLTSGAWHWDDVEGWNREGLFPKNEREAKSWKKRATEVEDIETEERCADMKMAIDAKEVDECAREFVTSEARRGFTVPPFGPGVDENIVDRYMREQKELDSQREEGPKPAKDVTSENGWIAPNGDFFACGMIQHESLADLMHKDGSKAIEKTHVKISVNAMSSIREEVFRPTKKRHTHAQKDKIWDWCEYHKKDVPPWVFGDKGTKFSERKK